MCHPGTPKYFYTYITQVKICITIQRNLDWSLIFWVNLSITSISIVYWPPMFSVTFKNRDTCPEICHYQWICTNAYRNICIVNPRERLDGDFFFTDCLLFDFSISLLCFVNGILKFQWKSQATSVSNISGVFSITVGVKINFMKFIH